MTHIPTNQRAWLGGAAAACLTLLVLAGCNDADASQPYDPSRLTETVVDEMYSKYISGNFEGYVDQMASLDDKPVEYREEMVALMKQRHRQQEEDHDGGPMACQTKRLDYTPDSLCCNAFILVTQYDSTEEVILLPLVSKDGKWRIR